MDIHTKDPSDYPEFYDPELYAERNSTKFLDEQMKNKAMKELGERLFQSALARLQKEVNK